jgi:hypothetical protein
LVTGCLRLDTLTRGQAAGICKVSVPLLNGKPRKIDQATITAWWLNASKDDRVALIRSFGPGETWDALSVVVS